MHFWSTKPILKILVSFMAGIVFYRFLHLYIILAVSSLILPCLILWRFLKKYLQFRLQLIPGALIHILLFSSGYLDMHLHDTRMNSGWFAKGNIKKQMIVSVNGMVKKKNQYYHSTAKVLYTFDENRWRTGCGSLVIHFPAAMDSPLHGDFFYVNTEVLPILPSKKNSSFDYQAYMALQHIYHNGYPKMPGIKKLNQAEHTTFFYAFTGHLRKNILGIMDRYIIGKDENGLAKALLIGYRDNLDKDIITAYTNTGVIHVIAISGLHLGLIYAMLSFLLSFFQNRKYLTSCRPIFIAAFLWIFSILCGASPSVLRSALMFTCLLGGEALQKENYTANALAASALILLCIDPMLLWDIGFQLSYAAVGSLLVYNRWLGRLYISSNSIVAFAWNSVSTSISAQVLTTPLILYHFHQFPVLFILANLVAVPLSGIILIMLIVLCMISPFPVIATPLALLTSWLSRVMNLQIARLNTISFSVVNNIEAGLTGTILFYASIVLLTCWLTSKKPFAALALLFVILVWIAMARSVCG